MTGRFWIGILIACALAFGLSFAGTAALAGNVLPETGAAVEGPQPEWLDESPPLPGHASLSPDNPGQILEALGKAAQGGKWLIMMMLAGILAVTATKMVAQWRVKQYKKSKLKWLLGRWQLWSMNGAASLLCAVAAPMLLGAPYSWGMLAAALVQLLSTAGAMQLKQDKAEG